jgi:hypothetical protein
MTEMSAGEARLGTATLSLMHAFPDFLRQRDHRKDAWSSTPWIQSGRILLISCTPISFFRGLLFLLLGLRAFG